MAGLERGARPKMRSFLPVYETLARGGATCVGESEKGRISEIMPKG
jgi:hypothetical protein